MRADGRSVRVSSMISVLFFNVKEQNPTEEGKIGGVC